MVLGKTCRSSADITRGTEPAGLAEHHRTEPVYEDEQCELPQVRPLVAFGTFAQTLVRVRVEYKGVARRQLPQSFLSHAGILSKAHTS